MSEILSWDIQTWAIAAPYIATIVASIGIIIMCGIAFWLWR
jgi:hypothetical protein